MGLKSPWFQFLVLCLCVSTVANSKPISVLKPEECAESCNTAKEGIVHKVETRDVKEDYTAEYRRASDTEEVFNSDSLNAFDIEETDDEDGDSSLDEDTSSGEVENIGGARTDNTVDDGDGISVMLDPEQPEMTIYDTVDDTSDDNPVVDDDDVTPEDDDDTFAVDDDDESGDHDDYANDLVDETQDIHDDDDGRNSSDVDDEDDSDVEEMLDDDSYDDDDDVDHVINTPENDDDSYDEVVNLDQPDVTFGVDDIVDDHHPDSNGDNTEGPIYIPEEHPHKYAKPTHHHHNPLKKHPDTKLGRLLKKHQSTAKTNDKSGRKNHDDIYDDDGDEDYDFQTQKRKDKFPSHKGRRTLSLNEYPDFDHVVKTNYPEKEDQEDGGNSPEKSANNADKQFVAFRKDLVKQAGSVAETNGDGKDASALVQEDPIEGEEEENQRAKVDSSVSDYEETQAVYSAETGQHYEEDKIEGEET